MFPELQGICDGAYTAFRVIGIGGAPVKGILVGLQPAFEVIILAGFIAKGIGFPESAVPGVIFTVLVVAAVGD